MVFHTAWISLAASRLFLYSLLKKLQVLFILFLTHSCTYCHSKSNKLVDWMLWFVMFPEYLISLWHCLHVFPHSWFVPESVVNILILQTLFECLGKRCTWTETVTQLYQGDFQIRTFLKDGDMFLLCLDANGTLIIESIHQSRLIVTSHEVQSMLMFLKSNLKY